MTAEYVPTISSQELSRCRERKGAPAFDEELNPSQKADARIQQSINEAFQKDGVIRSTEYPDFDAEVIDGTVYLNGHVTDEGGQNRILKAVEGTDGVQKVVNNLILDNVLSRQISVMLTKLPQSDDCVFKTGATHGVVVLSGQVPNSDLWKAAERTAASHPQVRGVSNYLHISDVNLGTQERRFVQPVGGAILKFQDGASGTVKQVIVDPDNRRVTDVVLEGAFPADAQTQDGMIVVSTDLLSYMSRESGALLIDSSEQDKYTHFDSARYTSPPQEWVPPYPYCRDDILFRRDGAL
jgi:osmotically-inducible protein OsmY